MFVKWHPFNPVFDKPDESGSDAGNPASDSSDAGTGENPAGTPTGATEGENGAEGSRPAPTQADLDKAYRTARKLEAENKKLREAKEAEEAKEKSELELAQDRIAKLEADRQEDAKRLRRANLIHKLGRPEVGVAPDAIELIASALEVEYDEDTGEPIDLQATVDAFLESHPSLKARTGGAGSGSPANGAAGRHSSGSTMTPADLKKLAKDNPDRFNEMWDKGEIPESALGG